MDARPVAGYEYVQVHSWGPDLCATLEHAAYGMFDVVTQRNALVEREHCEFVVSGANPAALLYALLDELLFRFVTPPFLAVKRLYITELESLPGSPRRLVVQCWGESFRRDTHPCGTEVKAVTKSNMHVTETEAFVILDI